MEPRKPANQWIRASCLLLAALALVNSGCLVVAAGAAAGAAAGYAYVQGRICQTYNANFNDAWAATRTALTELGMPIQAEERNPESGFLESRTGDGERVRIYLEAQPGRIPADGPLTRVCVRVATFGDHPVSDRILNQVGAHLVAVPPGSLPPAPPAAPTLNAPQAAPAATLPQTAPPPLAK